MANIGIQYLEPGPIVAGISPQDAAAHLRAAFQRLPLSLVIIGWNLPNALVSACAREVDRAGAQRLGEYLRR